MKQDKKLLEEIKRYYTEERGLLIKFMVTSVLVALIDLIGPYITKEIIDEIIPSKDINTLIKISIVMVTIYIVRFFIGRYSTSRGQLMGYNIKASMRKRLMDHVLSKPQSFFDKRSSGELISRFSSDMESVSSFMYRGLEDLLLSTLSLVGAFIFMIRVDVPLTIITFVPLPLALYYVARKNSQLKEGYMEIRKETGNYSNRVHDILKNIGLIKVNAIEDRLNDRHLESIDRLLETEKKNMYAVAELMSGIYLYTNITQLLVIFAGGALYAYGETTIGILVSFLLFVGRFRICIFRMMGLVDTYQRGASGIKRYREIMDVEDILPSGNKSFKGLQGGIALNALEFSYGDSKVINGVTLDIIKGEKIALVGPSGSGKTTLVNLIKKSYEASTGEILIDGVSIWEYENKSYYESLGVISQDPQILSATLEENINLYETGDIERPLKNVELSHKLKEWEDGPKTKLGEGGQKLSGGEMQRLSMARIFKKNPDIIILDEATSAMDNILEEKIIKSLKNIWEKKTVIAIAHRLQSIIDFDRILYMEDGRIVEEGTFNTLLEQKGRFYRMYNREIEDSE